MSDVTAPAPATRLPSGPIDLERQLPAIFDSVADGVTVIDRSGVPRFANEAAAHLMGLASPADVIGQSSTDLIGAFEMQNEDRKPLSQ